jgi:hypothetical protein
LLIDKVYISDRFPVEQIASTSSNKPLNYVVNDPMRITYFDVPPALSVTASPAASTTSTTATSSTAASTSTRRDDEEAVSSYAKSFCYVVVVVVVVQSQTFY